MQRRIICDTIFPKDQGEVYLYLNWSDIYPDSVEEIITYTPYPKSKTVRINDFVHLYHAHGIETRQLFTRVIMFLNKTPIHWYSRLKNTTEASTYRSEMAAMIIAT